MSSRPSLSALLDGHVTRPPHPLSNLIRIGERSSDLSFDRLGRLRAAVFLGPRSDEFLSDCEDDILKSILQTSIPRNRAILIVSWLIATFRCGSKEEPLAVVLTRLDAVWSSCFMLQNSSLAAAVDVNDVSVEELRASDHELELLWIGVCRSIYEARKACIAQEEGHESSPRVTSLILSDIVEGGFSREFSRRVRRAALNLDQRLKRSLVVRQQRLMSLSESASYRVLHIVLQNMVRHLRAVVITNSFLPIQSDLKA